MISGYLLQSLHLIFVQKQNIVNVQESKKDASHGKQ